MIADPSVPTTEQNSLHPGTTHPIGATDLTGASQYLWISARYTKQLIEAGALPAIRLPGGRYRIGYAALDALLTRGVDMGAMPIGVDR